MTFSEYYEIEPTYKHFLDLDGVIVDFEKQFSNLGFGTLEQYESKFGREGLQDKINNLDEDFWSTAQWLPDGKTLWEFLLPYNPTILSRPNRGVGRPACFSGKIKWIKRELGADIPYIIEENKEIYATPNSILIDDLSNNINKWNQKNGIGILHTSAIDTIKQLENVYGGRVTQPR